MVGNSKVKGQTLEYQAKEDIEAGEFVELIKKYQKTSGEVIENKLISENEILYFTSAELSENKLFIMYKVKEGLDYKLFGCVLNKNTMTIEKSTQLYSTRNTIPNISITTFNEEELLVIFNEGAYIYSSLVKVLDNTLTMRRKNFYRWKRYNCSFNCKIIRK